MQELGGVLPNNIVAVLQHPVSMWADEQLLTLFSALFIHTSWLHLLGNMAYLWVFGIPLERRLGWLGMMVVFLFGGALANLSVLKQSSVTRHGWANFLRQ